MYQGGSVKALTMYPPPQEASVALLNALEGEVIKGGGREGVCLAGIEMARQEGSLDFSP